MSEFSVFWTRGFVPVALVLGTVVVCCLAIPDPLRVGRQRSRLSEAVTLELADELEINCSNTEPGSAA
jgi:hypothetical protein